MNGSPVRSWLSVFGLLVAAGCAASPMTQHTDASGVLVAQGRYIEAEPLALSALKDAEAEALRTNGQPLNLGIASYNLGLVDSGLAKYTAAEASFRRALSVFQGLEGSGSPRVVAAMVRLGIVYTAQGRYDDADRVLRDGLKIVEKAGQADRPAGALFYQRLGVLYSRQGKYAEAEPLMRKALAIRERDKSEGDIAFSLDELGRLKFVQGSHGEAEPLLRRALEIREKLQPLDPLLVATTLNNLADLDLAQQKYSEGEPRYRRALSIRERMLPGDHPDLATTLDAYAALLRKTGREAEAGELEARAKAIWAKRSAEPQ